MILKYVVQILEPNSDTWYATGKRYSNKAKAISAAKWYVKTGAEALVADDTKGFRKVWSSVNPKGWRHPRGGKPRKPGIRTTCRRCGARGGYGGVRLWKGFCPQCRAERGKPIMSGGKKRRAARGAGLIAAAQAFKQALKG